MEVAEGIHRIEADLGDRVNCLYLLVGDERVLLVDTGLDESPKAFVTPYLDRLGLNPASIRWVVNTHCDMDHWGGNDAIRALSPGAGIVAHVADMPMIEDIEATISNRYREFEADHDVGHTRETHEWFRSNARAVPVDVGIRGGERFRLGHGWAVEIISTPGHSTGSISVHDPRSGSLIIGDAVLGDAVPLRNGARAFPPTYRDVDPYLATIDVIRSMSVSRLLSSHYPVFEGAEVEDFLYLSVAFVRELDAAIERALTGREMTLADLLAVLTADNGVWPGPVAEFLAYPVVGHLDRMVETGRARRDTGKPATYHSQG